MEGLMMDYQLTLRHILELAHRLHSRKQIVSRTAQGIERCTYGDLYGRVLRLANVLAELGVQPGDRVATLAFNSYRHLELYFAIPCTGAVLHTLNLRLFPHQLEYIINHAEDKIIFVDAPLIPLLEGFRDKLPSVRGFVIMGDGSDTGALTPSHDYETLMDRAAGDYELPDLDENSAAAMCYTSGTTGDPKGVLYSHRALFLHSMAETMANTIGLSEVDTVLVVVPQFHANAWGLPYACAMVGANQVFPGSFMQPHELAQLIQDEKVTVAAGVPTLWIGLHEHLKHKTYDFSNLRVMISGGSAMPRNLIEAFQKEHGVSVLHAWGMTETTPLGTVSRLKSHMTDWPEASRLDVQAKQGVPVPGIELRIVDAEGDPLPWDGETMGEVQVRGPWVVRQYFKTPVSPQSFTDDGWFRTGDVATVDEEGFMCITDRTKDLIKSGGEWISSVALENAIMAHPEVVECAVIALPHSKWQERPLAIAVLTEDARARGRLTKQQIGDFLEGKVASWWKPDDVVFVDELPKTSVGKFNKLALRERFADYELPTA